MEEKLDHTNLKETRKIISLLKKKGIKEYKDRNIHIVFSDNENVVVLKDENKPTKEEIAKQIAREEALAREQLKSREIKLPAHPVWGGDDE